MAVVTHSGARKNDGEIMEWKEEKQLIKNIQPNCVFKALITKIQRGVQMDSLFIQKSTGRGRKFSQGWWAKGGWSRTHMAHPLCVVRRAAETL